MPRKPTRDPLDPPPAPTIRQAQFRCVMCDRTFRAVPPGGDVHPVCPWCNYGKGILDRAAPETPN